MKKRPWSNPTRPTRPHMCEYLTGNANDYIGPTLVVRRPTNLMTFWMGDGLRKALHLVGTAAGFPLSCPERSLLGPQYSAQWCFLVTKIAHTFLLLCTKPSASGGRTSTLNPTGRLPSSPNPLNVVPRKKFPAAPLLTPGCIDRLLALASHVFLLSPNSRDRYAS